MNYIKDKRYINLLLSFLLFISFFTYNEILFHKASADSESLKAKEVYRAALDILNKKYYLKSRVSTDIYQNKYEDKIKNLHDAHKYITKVLKELNDPYTRLLTKEEFEDEQNIINSKLIGIGIKIANEKPVIVDILPNSPAKECGIKPNDYILNIDNRTTRNLSSNQIASLMRGPKGSILTIKLKRDKNTITKTLKRRELEFVSVSSKVLDDNIALLKVNSFIPEDTSRLFKEELIKLMSASGIIIDLRNNSGGLFKNAVEIADMFLSEGKIVSTVNPSGKTNEFANSNKLYGSNLVILVNEKTASASEILTSALKENNRAHIIGKKTYGKGLIQEIIKLPDDSALHVTVSSYLTPNGQNINKTGVIPDEIITDEDTQLKRAREILHSLMQDSQLASL
ncbi:MAG: hypothetical protein A3B68_05645 [Candidatus Melainabacteria bacterium RIFCSPHIGHO2_02_FULL_34_12]|nr:MAG: hypothetical protein A3B68_05645 [Candidatus Melainabacteria bacterium RIFCSPHIGHO2_02_FULL_34_12]